MNAQDDTLPDIELNAASGGKREQVTLEQYERILAQMIADAKKLPGTCPR